MYFAPADKNNHPRPSKVLDGSLDSQDDRPIRLFAMTQDERWMKRYREVVGFIETNKRNPSKYVAEERLMVHFLKRGRKMLNAGEMAEPRVSQFLELLALSEQYKRKNQWK